MGRQRIEMKKIENKRSLNVTFGKRRQALFKKAKELTDIHGDQVAIIVFSNSDKLYTFGSPGSSVNSVLDSYLQQQHGGDGDGDAVYVPIDVVDDDDDDDEDDIDYDDVKAMEAQAKMKSEVGLGEILKKNLKAFESPETTKRVGSDTTRYFLKKKKRPFDHTNDHQLSIPRKTISLEEEEIEMLNKKKKKEVDEMICLQRKD
ncbi:hypothetical protein AQUCO_00300807v1 [Aquilegia coerulea]|uniref:MADS-box domain-containing protein n=1 Tax=Aquilegia coerulea TaxID=218851 RepID=A0A2G5F0W6_AQUCA|nr:hypothetical protein AQUCO_00300807v1 [Aquilegia coerulea]